MVQSIIISNIDWSCDCTPQFFFVYFFTAGARFYFGDLSTQFGRVWVCIRLGLVGRYPHRSLESLEHCYKSNIFLIGD